MSHHTILGTALGGRYAPLLRGSGNQHHARGGTALTHILVRVSNTAATAGRHVFPDLVASNMFIDVSIFGAHLAPLTAEFFSHQLRQASKCSLAEFGTGDTNRDRVIGCDHDPMRHFGCRVGCLRTLYAKYKCAAQCCRLLQKGAS